MDDLVQLAGLIRRRNQLEQEITALIQRPAQIGHLGEYIAAHIFDIMLEQSAAHKGFDHIFLFDAPQLVEELRHRGTKIGIATSVRKQFWNDAELYPQQRSASFLLSDEQRRMLMLFGSEANAG